MPSPAPALPVPSVGVSESFPSAALGPASPGASGLSPVTSGSSPGTSGAPPLTAHQGTSALSPSTALLSGVPPAWPGPATPTP